MDNARMLTGASMNIVFRSGFVGGFLLKRFGPFEPSDTPAHRGHAHNIAHVSYVESGKVRVTLQNKDGSEEEHLVPKHHFILILPDVRHTFYAIEPNTTWLCEFAEAEAMKWIDQPHIRNAIRLLKGMNGTDETVKGLESMVIPGDMPDGIIENWAGPKWKRESEKT